MTTQTFNFEDYILTVTEKGFILEDKRELLLIDASNLDAGWAVECMIPQKRYKTYISQDPHEDTTFGFGKEE